MMWKLKATDIIWGLLCFGLSLSLSACGILFQQSGDAQNPTLAVMETSAVLTLTVKMSQLTPSPIPQFNSTPSGTETVTINSDVNSLQPIMTEPAPPLVETQQNDPTGMPSLVCNWADFVSDITIPDGCILSPGFRFTKTWRLKNIGSCRWTPGYSLVFASGELMGFTGNTALVGNVDPGRTVDLSVDLVSPTMPGDYQGNWMLKDPKGQVFGIGPDAARPFWVNVEVSIDNEIGTPTSIITTPTLVSSECQAHLDKSFEGELLQLINQERAKQGLFLLISQSQLVKAAREHSQDMACNNFYDHSGSMGSTTSERIESQRYIYSEASESIYHDENEPITPATTINAWLNSPKDKANILNGLFTQVGIGYFNNPGSSAGGYFTSIFARP